MVLTALKTLVDRLVGGHEHPHDEPADASCPAARPVPSRCYEVLVPYRDRRCPDPTAARRTLVLTVWAPSVNKALDCARERFHDFRLVHGRALEMAPEGPVALRTRSAAEEVCAGR